MYALLLCVAANICLPQTQTSICQPKSNPLFSLVRSSTISSKFGLRVHPLTNEIGIHEGLDISAKTGTPVLAVTDGVVVEVKRHRYYGRTIVIDHGHGIKSRSAHLKKYYVHVGEYVDINSYIGEVGMSGRVTGPHLHFELEILGQRVNPKISEQLFLQFMEQEK